MISGTPRILLIVENESVPADSRVWQEALALREAGYDVEVICPQGHAGHDHELFEVRDGILIFRFPSRRSDGSIRGYLCEYGLAVAHVLRLARQRIRFKRFDVIHVANPPDLLLPALAPFKLSGAQFVFDQHDLGPELYATRFAQRGLFYNALRVAEGMSFALADVVISTNESFRRIAVSRGHKQIGRAHV